MQPFSLLFGVVFHNSLLRRFRVENQFFISLDFECFFDFFIVIDERTTKPGTLEPRGRAFTQINTLRSYFPILNLRICPKFNITKSLLLSYWLKLRSTPSVWPGNQLFWFDPADPWLLGLSQLTASSKKLRYTSPTTYIINFYFYHSSSRME